MQASVRRFWLLRKTINRGNGTESLLRCCSAARILHSERPAFACDCRSYGWVAQLAEQWTENPAFRPASLTTTSTQCEQRRHETTKNDGHYVNITSTASRVSGNDVGRTLKTCGRCRQRRCA